MCDVCVKFCCVCGVLCVWMCVVVMCDVVCVICE